MNVEPWMDLVQGDVAPLPVRGAQFLLRERGRPSSPTASSGQ
ncbi:hypothetical protein SGUI_1361 [Serinicoccus hydrothermalis]|uniref:Uncharacterized protein n=1 Tax=Serinicoccus hydrothermalis TaxID=1758689 RepID=A0A1B1NBF0_9MICO|nr:hypothetical protein [Serinicoccus hydrothermalis]ANS78757.1 hypothetical protein SGUI_1361 [Serinicoccus hydrothermalis]